MRSKLVYNFNIVKKLICEIVFKYRDKLYEFEYDFGIDYPEYLAEFMFDEGNDSCDCNRSLHIKRYCDATFPEMECGEEIGLVEFKIKYI